MDGPFVTQSITPIHPFPLFFTKLCSAVVLLSSYSGHVSTSLCCSLSFSSMALSFLSPFPPWYLTYTALFSYLISLVVADCRPSSACCSTLTQACSIHSALMILMYPQAMPPTSLQFVSVLSDIIDIIELLFIL